MDRHGRNLHVQLDIPTRAHENLPILRDRLRAAIAAGETGAIELPLPGYAATIVELAPLDARLPVAEAEALLRYFNQFEHKFGAIARSPLGYPRNPRFVVLRVLAGTPAVDSAVRSAVAKHHQIRGDRPAIVWVKFGQSVDVQHARLPDLQGRIAERLSVELKAANAYRASGVAWVFNCSTLFPPTGHGFVVEQPGRNSRDDRQPKFVSLYVPNPHAARPIPENYLVPKNAW